MQLQRIKDMILGAAVMLLAVGTAPAVYAKVADMDISVMFRDIKIMANGRELRTEQEPFLYEGTAYLPVRAVAEALGCTVTWDADTKTVTLEEEAVPASKPQTTSTTSATSTTSTTSGLTPPGRPESTQQTAQIPQTEQTQEGRLGKLESKPSTYVNSLKLQCVNVSENVNTDQIQVEFKFTNPGELDQTVTLETLRVNNKRLDGSLRATVPAEDEARATLTLRGSDLDKKEIGNVYSINVTFCAYNHDDRDEVTSNEMILNFN